MPEVPPVPGHAGLSATLGERVAEVFAAGGALARAMPDFEPRQGQAQMAAAVARALETGGVLLAEAGTGTGKTLAYLVPAILSRQRVLVSTGTKNLQEQVFYKDIPALREALGLPFTAAYMKGRANYLCLHRLDQLTGETRSPGGRAAEPGAARGHGRPARAGASASADGARSRGRSNPAATRWEARAIPSAVAHVVLPLVREWVARTETGDRAELEDLPEDLPFWNELAATAETCLGTGCPRYDECFVTRMRQRAAAADVVIVNHHLLCADAAVRQSAYGEVIPACSHAIIDEAHQLEDVATQYFGLAVSNHRLEALAGDVARFAASGLVSGPKALDEIARAVELLRDAARTFFDDLASAHRTFARENERTPVSGRGEDRVRASEASLAEAGDAAAHLTGALELLQTVLEPVGQPEAGPAAASDAVEEARALARRAGSISDELRLLLRASDPSHVYFVEYRGKGVFLRAAPIDVAGIIRDLLLDRMRTTVLTSATMTVDGTFDYIRDRLGIATADEIRLPSEFDFATQTILYLPPRMPDPRSAAFATAAGRETVEILRRTGGRAFVLFTSYVSLRAVQGIAEMALDYPIFVQGTAPRTQLLKRFRETPHAVLLATSSFWQGVDVAGEALSCVIVDKLPFASPADPITSARIDAIRARGGEPFAEYQVPLAILTLQQGLGRLIRHRRDRGVLAVLDPRLVTKSYGRRFMASLPPSPVVQALRAVEEFFSL